jgi:hypothetical protein
MKNTKYSKYKIAPIAEDKDGKFQFPKTGFIAYKKARTCSIPMAIRSCIVTLFIPASAKKIAGQWNQSSRYAKRDGMTTTQYKASQNMPAGKMRASKAIVVSIKTFNGKDLKEAYSIHTIRGKRMKYVVGKTVTPATWNKSINTTCGGGIHFFRTKNEAKAY